MIPGSPAAVSDDLAPELRQKITDAFANKATEDYLKKNGFCKGSECRIGDKWGYVAIDDDAFDSVREVCRVTKDKQCQVAE
ncbi:hypothetical protein NKH18_43025 [Streptomyces sp. M10(2022)]